MTKNGKLDTPPPLLNREQAAARLGISVTEFRRRQRLGEFHPIKTGEKNELLFALGDVEKARQKDTNARQVAEREYTNEEAATVFAALSEGKTAVQCVIDHKVPPVAVEQLMAEYASLSGGLWIPSEMMRELNKMPLDGPMPMKEPGDLKAVLSAMLAAVHVTCLECGKRPRQVCKPCIQAALNEFRKKVEGTDEL